MPIPIVTFITFTKAGARIWPVFSRWLPIIVRPCWRHVIPLVTWAMFFKWLFSPLYIPFRSSKIMHTGFIIWLTIRSWGTPPTRGKSIYFTTFFSFATAWQCSGATVGISWSFRPTSKSVFIITRSPWKRTVCLFYFCFWTHWAVLPFQQFLHFKTLVKKGSRGISWRWITLLFPNLIFIMGRSSRCVFFGATGRLRSLPTLFPTFHVIRGRGGRRNWYIWWRITWWWWGRGGSWNFPFLLQPKKHNLWDNLHYRAKIRCRKQICTSPSLAEIGL